jgi:DNA-binding CsgD family transcriptional regulator
VNLKYEPSPFASFDHYYEMDYVGGMGWDPGPEYRAIIRAEQDIFNNSGGARWMVAHDMDATGASEVGFVAGCLLLDWAADAIIHADEPYPHRKFLKWRKEGKNPFVSGDQIGRANAGGGLNFMVTHFGWDRSLSPDLAAYVRSHVMMKFSEYYAGMKYKLMIAELYSEDGIQDCLTAGYRLRNEYPNWTPNPGDNQFRPVLMTVSREEALGGSNYFMMRVFSHQSPTIVFTEPQREVLLQARIGKSDMEIADTLSISQDAVKDRWKKIYARVEDAVPGLLPNAKGEGRGPEKRRMLMSYLENHPSEFWPYLP